MEDVIAVILGGGKGTRLYPLTKLRSKPAVPFGGKYRLIDISISNCINSTIERVFVLTQFNSISLNRHITRTYRFGSFSRGFVDILAARQTETSSDWYQGTADAVRQNLHTFNDRRHSHVLILSGDHLYRMDYREFVAHHLKTNADITIGVLPVTRTQAPELGIVATDPDGRIVRFAEKPSDPELLDSLRLKAPLPGQSSPPNGKREYLASMGIYVFRREALAAVLADRSMSDFGKEVIPAAMNNFRVMSYFFDGYWQDIGTIRSFYEANLELTTPVPAFNFYDELHPIYSRARFLPASKVNACSIEHALIADGCIINRSEIRHSVVGLRSVIGENSRILHSVLMGADYYQAQVPSGPALSGIPVGIGPNCHIERAIIDKDARIGAGVQIVNRRKVRECDQPEYSIRDGIVVIPKNAVLPPGTVI